MDSPSSRVIRSARPDWPPRCRSRPSAVWTRIVGRLTGRGSISTAGDRRAQDDSPPSPRLLTFTMPRQRDPTYKDGSDGADDCRSSSSSAGRASLRCPASVPAQTVGGHKGAGEPHCEPPAAVERIELHVAQDDLVVSPTSSRFGRDPAVAGDHALQAFVDLPGGAAVIGALDVIVVDHVEQVGVVGTDEKTLRLGRPVPGSAVARRPFPSSTSRASCSYRRRRRTPCRSWPPEACTMPMSERQERPYLLDGAALAVTEVRNHEQRRFWKVPSPCSERDQTPASPNPTMSAPSAAGDVGQEARVPSTRQSPAS